MENFKHKKSLGQNFLHDNNILSRIKESVTVTKNDLIIEIGPGQGALTRFLKEYGAYLICYEIDELTKSFLAKFEDEKTKIIYKDFLKADVVDDLKNVKYEKLFVIANLPYYITTPIIEKIIATNLDVEEMILMVQKEVAERFSSKPSSKKYGSLTVYLNYFFEIEKLFNVSRNSFIPVPNVDSAVVSLKKKIEKYHVIDEKHFYKLIKDSFVHKRKNIRNNLYNYNLEIVEEVLQSYGFNLKSRAEELDISIFINLSNELVSRK